MKSLGARAVVIALCLIALTLLLATAVKASVTATNKPDFVVAPQSALTPPQGYDKHQEALRRIVLGMDLSKVSEIFGQLVDPKNDFVKIEVDEKDPSNVRLFWKWTNSFLNGNDVVQEASELTVFVECHRVIIVSLDYLRMDQNSMSKESKLKGLRAVLEPEKN